MFDPHFLVALMGIVWMDLILSGDNAVVIAMACQNLPEEQRRIGMMLGTVAAVVLRIVCGVFVGVLMAISGISIVAGLFLLYVAIKLLTDNASHSDIAKPTTLWAAVSTVAIADIMMSVDNVMAVAGMSHGDPLLMALGIVISIPMMIIGASLISSMLTRFPVLVWAGAALLGWVAGGIITHDPLLADKNLPWFASYVSSALGAGFVVILGLMLTTAKRASIKIGA